MTRFPKDIPSDILSRADELLSAKYGTDRPIDPELVILMCRMAIEERHAMFHEAVEQAFAKAARGTE